MEEHQQEAERLQARLSGQQSAGAELQEELGEQQQLLQRAQEARRAAAEVSTPAGASCHSAAAQAQEASSPRGGHPHRDLLHLSSSCSGHRRRRELLWM